TEKDFVAQCAKVGLTVQPLSRYCQNDHSKAAVLFGYAAHSVNEIRENIEKLAQDF
ncbi:MAG: PLP-dependent aminotransferase family protein, partial [Acinetobacter sp.]